MGGFSAFFIHRPVATSLMALGLFLVGALAFFLLPAAPLPSIEMPVIVVSARLPGADPETVAATVAAPLERRLGIIPGVNEIVSTSGQGRTSIVLQFDLSRNIDGAGRDVQAAISASGGDLPADLPSPPTYRKVNPDNAAIITLAVVSPTLTSGRLYDICDTILASRISQIEGVAQAMVGGAEKPAVRVAMNPARIAALGLGLDDIRSSIADANVRAPLGRFEDGSRSAMIRANDQIRALDEYASIIVRTNDGAVTRLSHIADVSEGVEDDKRAAWRNLEPAALIFVRKHADANIVETVDKVRAILPTLQSWMPPGTEITVVNDRSRTIRASIEDVEIAMLASIILVILVVWFALGRKTPTISASITAPLSLAGAMAVMWALGYTLNNVTLMALTVSVGFVVDDAIVMIENITRHAQKDGRDPMRAAINGARQIAFTILSISISLVSVFIPILFMDGVVGRFFREFAVTLSVAIMVSALVSLTVTPMVYAHLMALSQKRGREAERPPSLGERLMTRLERLYEKSLSVALRRQYATLLALLGAVFLTGVLYVMIPKGFLPEQDIGAIRISTEGRSDISFDAMKARQQEVAAIVLADPDVDVFSSFIGAGNGASASTGRLFVTLKPLGERQASAREVINRLRKKLEPLPGVSVFYSPEQDFRFGGRSSKGAYQFVISGESLDELRIWAPRLIDALKGASGFEDVSSDQENFGQEIKIVMDRDLMARMGVSVSAVGAVLQNAFAQRQISTIYTERNQYKVVLEAGHSFSEDQQALAGLYVAGADGAPIPLFAIARIEDSIAPLSITHQGQFPSIGVSYNLADGGSLGEAMDKVNRVAEEIGLPASVRLEPSGAARYFEKTFSNQPMLIITAILAIYIILGVLYENLIHPVTILSTLPSASLGALLALVIVGGELTLISIIGVILLLGIVKKNGIIMVDFAIENQRLRGFSPERAIYDAAKRRFRPIFMTTLAAIFGAIPLAVGGGVGAELRQPLGVAVVGGLLVSQILTLYTTPVVFLALSRLGRKKKREPALS